MLSKICNNCGESLTLNQFNKDKRVSDGYARRCRSCTSNYTKEFHESINKINKQGLGSDYPKTKKCSTCGSIKEVIHFHKNSYHKDGHAHECKQCCTVRQAAYYLKNKEKSKIRVKLWSIKHKKSIEARNKKELSVRRHIINKYKKDNGCYFCGEDEPIALDFHHKDPTQKDYNVSNLTRSTGKKLWEEIDKCIVVCASCHRKLHAGLLVL